MYVYGKESIFMQFWETKSNYSCLHIQKKIFSQDSTNDIEFETEGRIKDFIWNPVKFYLCIKIRIPCWSYNGQLTPSLDRFLFSSHWMYAVKWRSFLFLIAVKYGTYIRAALHKYFSLFCSLLIEWVSLGFNNQTAVNNWNIKWASSFLGLVVPFRWLRMLEYSKNR